MSWENIIRKRISMYAKSTIDRIMADGEKRTTKEIIKMMWEHIESNKGVSGDRSMRTGRIIIPTTNELIRYLIDNDYESEIYDTRTGNVVKIKNNIYHVRRYWK